MLSYYNKALNPLRCTGNIFTSNQPSIEKLIEKRKGIIKKLNLFYRLPITSLSLVPFYSVSLIFFSFLFFVSSLFCLFLLSSLAFLMLHLNSFVL